jgi:hypothetical protein
MILAILLACAPDCSGHYASQAAIDRAAACTALPELWLEDDSDITTIDLPLVETIAYARLNAPLVRISMPSLVTAGSMTTPSPVLSSVELPALETVDELSLDSFVVSTLDLASLELAGDIFLGSGPAVLALPELTQVGRFQTNGRTVGIRTLLLPRLETADVLEPEGRLRELEAPLLNGQDVTISFPSPFMERVALTGLEGNPTLIFREQTESTDLTLELSTAARPHLCFRGPSDLTTLGVTGPTQLSELSIRGVPFTSLDLAGITEIQALDLGESSSLPLPAQEALSDLHSTNQTTDRCPF